MDIIGPLKTLWLKKRDKYLVITFFFSLISFLLISLNLINLFQGIKNLPGINLIYLISVYGASIYTLLFLPSCPALLITSKTDRFGSLEKLTILIVFNLSFYIIFGYIAHFLGLKITGWFFLISTFIAYVLILGMSIVYKYKYKFDSKINSIKNKKKIVDKNKISLQLKDLKSYIKNNLSLNSLLLIVFILLICLLNIVRVSYFYGTDPWLHISIIKIITEINRIPIKEYYGTVGLHVFCAVFEFFTNIDTMLIPKYFVFYTIPLSALIFYIFLKKIFRNKNLAYFGVFFLEISSLGFDYMMYQFWPSSIVILQMLTIFYLLYSKLSWNLKQTKNSLKDILRKSPFIYGISMFIFISALFSHSLTSIVLLITFLWVFFIYFIRDYRKGFDFLFLLVLGITFLIFFRLGIGTRHFWFLKYLSDLAFPLLLLSFSLIASITGILIWQIYKSIDFSDENFYKTLKGEKNKKLKMIEDKYFIPIVIGCLLFFTSLFILGNIFIFTVNISFIFSIMQTIILITLCIWGILIFQKKSIGKSIMIWLIGFFIVLIGVVIFDIFISGERYFERVLYMMAPPIVIGFLSYVYKLIKIGKIQKVSIKTFFVIFVIFSLLTTFYQGHIAITDVSLKRKEVPGIQWYCNYNSKRAVIITEFGLTNIFIYYDYPYNESEITRSDKTHYYIDYREELFRPDNHFNDTGDNILKYYKMKYNSNVYLTIDEQYYLNVDLKPYGYLSEDDLEQYYRSRYINKIYSSISKEGDENPLYWVI